MSGVTTHSSASKNSSATGAKAKSAPKTKTNSTTTTSAATKAISKSKATTSLSTSTKSLTASKSSVSQTSHTNSSIPSQASSRAGSAASASSSKDQPLNAQEAALLKALLKRNKDANKSLQSDLDKEICSKTQAMLNTEAALGSDDDDAESSRPRKCTRAKSPSPQLDEDKEMLAGIVGDDEAGELDGLRDQDDVNNLGDDHFSDNEGNAEGQNDDPKTNVEGTEKESKDEGGAKMGLSVFGGGEDNRIEVNHEEVKPFKLKEAKVKKEKTMKSEDDEDREEYLWSIIQDTAKMKPIYQAAFDVASHNSQVWYSLVGAWYGITGSQCSMEDNTTRVQWLIQDAHFAFGDMNYEVEHALKEWSSGKYEAQKFSDVIWKPRFLYFINIWNQLVKKAPKWVEAKLSSMFKTMIYDMNLDHMLLGDEDDAMADSMDIDFSALNELAEAGKV
ncbi:hypothetical protein L208DRAFT_1382663 [Tricholoma matsutake]|nr:hypothetical protein L208DRAFT_1382663 [Tricholoma matsutake 945]